MTRAVGEGHLRARNYLSPLLRLVGEDADRGDAEDVLPAEDEVNLRTRIAEGVLGQDLDRIGDKSRVARRALDLCLDDRAVVVDVRTSRSQAWRDDTLAFPCLRLSCDSDCAATAPSDSAGLASAVVSGGMVAFVAYPCVAPEGYRTPRRLNNCMTNTCRKTRFSTLLMMKDIFAAPSVKSAFARPRVPCRCRPQQNLDVATHRKRRDRHKKGPTRWLGSVPPEHVMRALQHDRGVLDGVRCGKVAGAEVTRLHLVKLGHLALAALLLRDRTARVEGAARGRIDR